MKKTLKKTSVIMATVLSFVLLAASVYASTINTTLNVWNVDNTIADYGTVKVEDTGTGVSFTVTASDMFIAGNKGLIWDKFFFNVSDPSLVVASNFTLPTIGSWSFATTSNASTFGLFDDSTAGSSITSSLNPLAFSYTGTLNAEDFVQLNSDGYYFSGHLRGFTSPTVTGQSVFLAANDSTAPVPEPGTMMLLGAGFLGLAVYGKRRKNA